MKKISLILLLVTVTVATAFAQDANQQQLDQLRGKLQDIVDAQDAQNKRIDELSKRVSELADKVNTPQVNNSASAEDLKALADSVKEIDRKRQSDRELILKEIDKAGNASTSTKHTRVSAPPVTTTTSDTPTAPAGPQTGHPYTVAEGDTLSAIAKAYRDQGVKVTTKDIINANPGLDATKLYVGKKIFIPDPAAASK